MSQSVKHIVTVRVQYDDPDRLADGDFSVVLVNCSGVLDLNGSGETDIDLINECVWDWLVGGLKPRARFVELTLREEWEASDPGYQKRYDVVESYTDEVAP